MENFLIYNISSDNFYRKEIVNVPDIDLEFAIWHPGAKELIPHGLPRKYFIYWLFHFLHIFRNREYKAVFAFLDKKLACSYLIVPKYFKWHFMKQSDVQFIYVKTYPDYRGKGIAYRTLCFGLSECFKKAGKVWYVTDESNAASQSLALKSGFELFSHGRRGYLFNLKFLKTVVTNNIADV